MELKNVLPLFVCFYQHSTTSIANRSDQDAVRHLWFKVQKTKHLLTYLREEPLLLDISGKQ